MFWGKFGEKMEKRCFFNVSSIQFLSRTERTDDTEKLFFRSAQEIVCARHSPSKLDSALAYSNFPTDFLTRLLLCSAIRVNSIALAYRKNYSLWS